MQTSGASAINQTFWLGCLIKSFVSLSIVYLAAIIASSSHTKEEMYLKTIILTLLILLSLFRSGLFAQNSNQTLEVKFGTFGITYYAGKSEIAEKSKITKRQFLTKLKTDEEAYRQFKTGRIYTTVGNIII